MLHSLSRDRGEGDQSVFSQILIAIFEDENDIFFFFPTYWKPPKVLTLFLRLTDHSFAKLSSVASAPLNTI